MTEIIHLVEATPRNPGVGLVTVRMVSARSHARDTVKNSQSWVPALTSAPVQGIKFLGDDQMPGILEIGYGALGIRFSPDLGNDVWSAYVWEGADATVWRGESGAAFGTFEKIFTGRCGALERQNANIGSIALRGYEGDLDRDLLSSTYAGTGGAEGDLAMKGVPKPWMSGPCEGVPGVLIDKVNWIWQLHGYGAIDDITAAYEGGLTLGSAHATVPTTYAALAALSMGGASWAKAPAVGMVRLGYEPSRPVVFDARGAKDGSTYVSKVGAITSHLLKVAGFESGDINSTSASNLDTAFAHDWGYYTAMQASIGDVVRKALADIGGYAFPDESGIWRFGRYKAIKTATALKSDRTAAPIVRSVSQRVSLSPIGRVEVGARRCWGVHREDEISPALLDAIDAAQAAADAAQSTNSVNLYRVETAGVTSSIALVGAGAGTEAAFGYAGGGLLSSVPASDPVAHIILADNGVAVGDQISVSGEVSFTDTGSTMALRVRFVDAAGTQVGIQTLTGITGSATWTKMQSPSLTVPAGAVALHVVNRTNGGTGTAGIRNVMVNRGPICAPYVPPVRGADFTATSPVGINFNARNDRNAAAVTAPTIATDGTAVDHTIATDGSCNISFEWSWGGTEADIDGFIVYVYRSASGSAYTFGTTAAEEQTFFVAPDRRALLIYGVPADAYYTFGVRAYRIVDPDVNAAGRILSTLVKATGSGENPYRPSASVAFAGNVSGTVDGSAASTVAAGALAANNGVNSDGTIKDDKVDTPAIVDDAISGLPNATGSGTFNHTGWTTRATYTFTAAADEKYLVLISGIIILGELAAAGTYAEVQLEKNSSTSGALIATAVSRVLNVEQMFCFPITMTGLSGSQTLDLRLRASATHGAGDPHLVERAGIHIIKLNR